MKWMKQRNDIRDKNSLLLLLSGRENKICSIGKKKTGDGLIVLIRWSFALQWLISLWSFGTVKNGLHICLGESGHVHWMRNFIQIIQIIQISFHSRGRSSSLRSPWNKSITQAYKHKHIVHCTKSSQVPRAWKHCVYITVVQCKHQASCNPPPASLSSSAVPLLH